MLDFELGDVNPNDVEGIAGSDGLIPKGKYHVRLDGASDRMSKQPGGGMGSDLEYKILAGPCAGQTIKDTVWHPHENQEEDRAKKTKNRFALFAHRLGLVAFNPQSKKYELANGKNSFGDVLGAEAVIEVTHRTYKRDDGGTGTAINVTFGGIWSVDDKAVKDVPKAKSGGQPAKPGGAPQPDPQQPAKKKADVSDL